MAYILAYRQVAYILSELQIREKPRLIDHGPFAYVRHPIYTQVSHSIFTVYRTASLTIPMHSGALIDQASLVLVLWSYLPLCSLAVAIGGCLLKVPIEVRGVHHSPCRSGELIYECTFQERTMLEDPKLGDQYKLYKRKVPYKLIPYVW